MRPRCLSTDQIEQKAIEFRKRYAPGVVGALDIEAILEHDLGLTIVPKKDFTRKTGNKAWLSCDGGSIYVDEALMCGAVDEYRFTITHEGAHAVLHRPLLPERPFRDRREFWDYHQRLSVRDNYFLEWQAREWAGRVLVPTDELVDVFEKAFLRGLRLIGRRIGPLGLFIEQEVGEHFGVTPACARVRISKEGLWRRLRCVAV